MFLLSLRRAALLETSYYSTRGRLAKQDGFTLVELVVVVALIAVIGTLSVQRLGSILGWQHESEIRELSATWQFLHNEASARSESYRLVINLSENSYYVLREVPLDPGESVQVDYLKNLRTKGEQERRAEEERKDLKSVEEEFEEEDKRQSGALDALYYQSRFRDPNAGVRLSPPLEFPSLAEKKQLSDGLEIRDVILDGEEVESGTIILRVAGAASQFALLHLAAGEQIFTVYNNPATSVVEVKGGDLDFEWKLNDTRYESSSKRS